MTAATNHGASSGRVLGAAVLLVGAPGVWGGAIWGFVRGLDYLPTLPFAVIEGALLFGVPAFVLGLLVGGLAVLSRPLWAVRR